LYIIGEEKLAVDPQSPPQDILKYKLRGDKPLFQGDKALPADIVSKWLNDYVYEPNTQALRVTMDSPFGSDIVYKEDEFADPLTRLGLLTGGVDILTNEYTALRLTGDGRLMVDAAITIQNVDLDVEIDVLDGDQIGIWGYEDGNTGSPIPINLTSEGFLQVSVVGNENMGIIYDEGTLSGGVEHSLVSHTVTAGQEFNLARISGTGRTNGIFRVKVNGTTIETKRNAWTDRNVEFVYTKGLPLTAGDTVELTVIHNQLTSTPFSGTIYGEDQ